MKWYGALSFVSAAAVCVGCADSPTVPGAPGGARLALVDPSASITGSIKTTLPTCVVVNANVQYISKEDVYLNGGGGALGPLVPAGDYYVRVSSPQGTVLGTSPSANYTVPESGPNPCVQVWGLVLKQSDGTQGYDDTDNSGNEYQLEVCADAAFTPSRCKYDNFKVRKVEGPPPTQYGILTVDKFFDANGNGARDGEPLISGWLMTLNELLPNAIATQGTPASWSNLPEATYSVTEGKPVNAASWYISYKGPSSGLATDNLLSASVQLSLATPSDLTIGGINVVADGTESRLFGNYCRVGGGGRTLGFWSNNNGQAILRVNDQAWRLLLNAPAFVKASPTKNGYNVTPYDVPLLPTVFEIYNSKKQLTGGAYYSFNQWILAAQSSSNGEARYMLSAQLAAMLLNTNYSDVPGTPFVDGTAFDPASGMTINQLIAAATAALADPAVSREQVLQLKTWLDLLNKGGTVIPSSVAGCGTLTF